MPVSAEPGVEAETNLVSLRDWLAAEEALRGRVELRAQTPRPLRVMEDLYAAQ